MTDDAAFLRAIVAAPDDDLPRLVYADWLDENGQPARAEFIRVQCELAKVDVHGERFWDGQLGDGPKWYWEAKALRRRERELWPLVSGSFPALGQDPIYNTSPQYQTSLGTFDVRRGFVETITCPARTFLERCHDLRAACPLREATLTGDVDPDWFRGFVMSDAPGHRGQREGVRLCDGKAELGIVAAVYDAHRDRRSEWGRKLFLDLLHAGFRPMTFRLAGWADATRRGQTPQLLVRDPRAFITGTP